MPVKDLLKKGLDELCHIIFPKLCLHCKEKIADHFFCDHCLSFFELIEEKDIKSFSSFSHPIVSAFEDVEAVHTFFLELKKMTIPIFAKLGASYMVLQYLKLNRPLPDIVVPLSNSGFGVKYTDILAKEVAKLLKRPIKKCFFHAKILALQDKLFMTRETLQDKSLLIVVDKLDEQKMTAAVDILEKRNFKNFRFLALCQ